MSYSQTVNAAVASRTSSGAPPRPRGSSSATNAPQAESTGRLRGSCECCAKSKVKCGKEKPTCARCAARGTQCIYLESRRPGRVAGQHYGRTNPRPKIDRDAMKRHDSFVQPQSPTQRQNSMISTSSGQISPHVEVAPMYPMLPEAATNATGLGLSDATSSIIGSIGDMTSSSVNPSPTTEYPLDWGFDFNDMMIDAGSLDLTMEQNPFSNFMDLGDAQGASSLWPMYDDGSNTGNNSFSATTSNTVSNMSQFTFPPDGAKVASDNFSPLGSPLSSSSSAVDLGNLNSSTAHMMHPEVNMNTLPMVTELDTVQEAPANDSCDCASQALDILKTLSRSQSPGPSSGRRRPSSSSILSTNKESAEGIIALLACSRCTEDRFLLATSLMIAMKLLGRYASVAASWSSNTSSPVLSANSSFGSRASSTGGNLMTPVSGMSRTTSSTSVATTADLEEVSPREAIQSVLRELHRVQRLIAQLPGRIANSEGQQSTTNLFSTSFIDQQNISPTDMLGDIIPTPPLSARALSQVEEDVRTSLKELSANLRNSLNSC
ncbi:hypothetical protein PRZ48_012163 [Zasmidium cellare]|uniref:Zn(2)-C6 fungal-type domain-containing protein n=1 Tax=Zasmidium cellare TaxID=395010 RepID=A0ABR0E502_ZASCE|nr:hypothetical protein PRZ48_012163 [Zasmidium cellare]